MGNGYPPLSAMEWRPMDALWHGVAVGKQHALLLLDARMPDTDGLSLAAKIRERAELSGGRIVLLTFG